MLDVHPPHEKIHGWRDFLLHLLTITVGLLIALGLEGCLEWQHHRHLVHEAEKSLEGEIRTNAGGLKEYAAALKKNREELAHDLIVLREVVRTGKYPAQEHLTIGFNIRGLNDVSWRTAQSTGALSYMPYSTAQEYADIYNTQEELSVAEHTAARDTVVGIAPFAGTGPDDPPPPPAQAAIITDRIGILQGQLQLVDSLVKELQVEYDRFLAAHR